MIITAIRHPSVDVPSGICYGISDVPLAAIFPSELESIRQKLVDEKFDAVFSSPLSRCTKLATVLFPERKIGIDQRLIELDFGVWEMTEWDQIFASPEGKEWFGDFVNTPCPNGESLQQMIVRAKKFLNDLEKTTCTRVALVTHAGFIRSLMSILQDKTPEEAFQTPLAYGQIIHFNH